MSTKDEGVSGGGQNGPSGDVEKGEDGIVSIARHIGERALQISGQPTPEALIQMDLRSEAGRRDVFEKLVAELVPHGVHPSIWARWLAGGPDPFGSTGIKKPAARQQQGAGKTLGRGPATLRKHYARVDEARQALAEAEEQLAYHEALDRSVLEWMVTDHMTRLLGSIFAMGPAWTLMRSVAGYASEEAADFATRTMDPGPSRERAKAEFRKTREAESVEMLEALDFFSGDHEFETDVRKALADVIRFHEKRRPALQAKGHKSRTPPRAATTINPTAKRDGAAVVEALKLAS